MTERPVETSPQLYARIGGVLYLIIIVVGVFGEAFVRGRLIISGDATTTAANIRSLESLWRSIRGDNVSFLSPKLLRLQRATALTAKPVRLCGTGDEVSSG